MHGPAQWVLRHAIPFDPPEAPWFSECSAKAALAADPPGPNRFVYAETLKTSDSGLLNFFPLFG
jgi:hypothetical protein